MTSKLSFQSQIRDLLARSLFDQAADRCIEALAKWPADPDLLVLLALSDEGRGDLAGARALLDKALIEAPQHADGRYHSARLLLIAGRIEQARAQFEHNLSLHPNHALSYTALARLHHAQGRIDQAIETLRTALRADHDHVPALTSLASLLLDRGELEEAHQLASQALKLAPDSPASQLAMGLVLLAQGYMDFAERCLANAAAADPDNPRVHLAMARLLQRLNRHGDALLALDACERLGSQGPPVMRAQAHSLAALGRLPEARQLLEQLLAREEDAEEVLLALIEVLVSQGDASALAGLRDRIRAGRPALQIWLEARQAQLEGQSLLALQKLQAGLAQAPAELERSMRLLAAELLIDQGDSAQVCTQLQPLIAEAKTDVGLTWRLAGLARLAGVPEFALSVLEPLMGDERLSDDARSRTAVMLADLYDQTDRFEEAAAQFSTAAWQAPYLGSLGDPDQQQDTLDIEAISPWPWPSEILAPGRPVFLTGWPCSGRDLVLVALAQTGLAVLPLADWPTRRSHLGLPLSLDQLSRLDASSLHLARRRYLRAAAGKPEALETAAILARDLPLIARVFPGASVLVPKVEEPYLMLQWRLAGYRQVPSMRKTWHDEQALLSRLRESLPLSFIDFSLPELLTAPEQSLMEICSQLNLHYRPTMAETLSNLVAERGYRPPGHWRRYPASAI